MSHIRSSHVFVFHNEANVFVVLNDFLLHINNLCIVLTNVIFYLQNTSKIISLSLLDIYIIIAFFIYCVFKFEIFIHICIHTFSFKKILYM